MDKVILWCLFAAGITAVRKMSPRWTDYSHGIDKHLWDIQRAQGYPPMGLIRTV